MSAAYNFVPVHIITVYLAPYHTKEVEESKNRLKHLVSSILDRVRTSRILIMGDFNHHRVEVTNFLQLKGLTFSYQKVPLRTPVEATSIKLSQTSNLSKRNAMK